MVYMQDVHEVENHQGIYAGQTERGRWLNLKKLGSSFIRYTLANGIQTDPPNTTNPPPWMCEWAGEEFKKFARKEKMFLDLSSIHCPVPSHLEIYYNIYAELKNPFKKNRKLA